MNWPSIPRTIPRWLHRHPLALTTAVTCVNRIRRLGRRRSVSSFIAITVLAVLFLTLVAAADWTSFVMQQALSYSGIVVAASGLYAAFLMSRHRRTIETVRAQSWLVATPLASRGSMQTLLLTVLPLVWRTVAAVALAVLLSLGASVSVEQSLQLSALIAIGTAAGGSCGWWLSRGRSQGKPPSRYTPRRRPETNIAPSTDALAHWFHCTGLRMGTPGERSPVARCGDTHDPRRYRHPRRVVHSWHVDCWVLSRGLAHCDPARWSRGISMVAIHSDHVLGFCLASGSARAPASGHRNVRCNGRCAGSKRISADCNVPRSDLAGVCGADMDYQSRRRLPWALLRDENRYIHARRPGG